MREYGGYLPLELKIKKEFYSYQNHNMMRLNSGKSAIFYALQMMDIKKIHIPYYICNSVVDTIRKTDVEIIPYHINYQYIPINIHMQPGDGILIVNYFGTQTSVMKRLIKAFSNIIIDNTQAFFSKPIMRNDIFNIYSPKKFVGVPDGGYLIGKNILIPKYTIPRDQSSPYSDFLIESLEFGTNYSYQKKLDNDKRFKSSFLKMSTFTETLLKSIDYNYVIERRVNNFNTLHSLLKKYNRNNLDSLDSVACYYPLFLDFDLRDELIKKKIYVPTLWSEMLSNIDNCPVEYDLSKHTLFLPIDQRYEKQDMEYIANIVIALLEERK